MNDRVKFELLEEVAGRAAADALERAAAPAKPGFRTGKCDLVTSAGGREVVVAAMANRVKIDEAGCHIWQGGLNSGGYGVVYIRRRAYSAHRLQYEIANGPIPTTGAPDKASWMVLHKCDIPACCNPEHLYLGTSSDNARDRANRARMRAGFRVHSYMTHPGHGKVPCGTVFYEIQGVIQSLADWSSRFGIHQATLELRLLNGWSIEGLARPPRNGYRHAGPRTEYRRFSGEPAVLEYLSNKMRDG